MKTWNYKGVEISLYLSGWFSATTPKGIVKADTLAGIKELINKAIDN